MLAIFVPAQAIGDDRSASIRKQAQDEVEALTAKSKKKLADHNNAEADASEARRKKADDVLKKTGPQGKVVRRYEAPSEEAKARATDISEETLSQESKALKTELNTLFKVLNNRTDKKPSFSDESHVLKLFETLNAAKDISTLFQNTEFNRATILRRLHTLRLLAERYLEAAKAIENVSELPKEMTIDSLVSTRAKDFKSDLMTDDSKANLESRTRLENARVFTDKERNTLEWKHELVLAGRAGRELTSKIKSLVTEVDGEIHAQPKTISSSRVSK